MRACQYVLFYSAGVLRWCAYVRVEVGRQHELENGGRVSPVLLTFCSQNPHVTVTPSLDLTLSVASFLRAVSFLHPPPPCFFTHHTYTLRTQPIHQTVLGVEPV